MSIFLYPHKKHLDDSGNIKSTGETSRSESHLICKLHGNAVQAYTMVELVAIICIIFLIMLFGYLLLRSGKKAAFTITAKHDLVMFVELMDDYYIENNRFIGVIGHTIRNDGRPSDYVLKHFIPSQGVVITVVAGDPEDPYNPDNPYIVESRHISVETAFDYNFVDRGIVHKQVEYGK